MKTNIVIGYSTNRSAKFIAEYNKHIKKTIGCPFSIIPIVNDGSMGLAYAYNQIWKQSEADCYDEGRIFIMIHHDLHFKTNGWGRTILNLFNDNPDTDIIGVAGTNELNTNCIWWANMQGQFNHIHLWGKVWHKNGTAENKSDFTTPMKKCAKLQPVVATDGLFIAFNPDRCERFDEELTGFHFYDVSFCLRNLRQGRKIAVTETVPICHDSGGVLSKEWDDARQFTALKYSAILPARV